MFHPAPMQVVSRSGDGGLSWSLPATVQFKPGVYSDKSAVTADPFRAGRAYDVWDARTGSDVATGAAWFSRSSDGGRTWSPPRLLYDPGEEEVAPLSNMIAVLPHRVLLNVMQVADSASNTSDVMAARSVGGGRTWSPPPSRGMPPHRDGCFHDGAFRVYDRVGTPDDAHFEAQ
jgi:Neuraminidase (sialidase)